MLEEKKTEWRLCPTLIHTEPLGELLVYKDIPCTCKHTATLSK